MKQSIPLLLTVFCLLFFSLCKAQSWQSLYDSSTIYFNNEAYDKAIAVLSKALPVAKSNFVKNPHDTTYASTLYLLGDCYWWAGYYPETETQFKDYLMVIKTKYGEKDKMYASRLADMGALYYDMGRYNEAEDLYKKALALDKEHNRDNHIDYITTLNNLAVLYNGMGRYELSEPLYKRVLDGYKKLLGNQHPSYTTAINNLASLYYYMGRYTEAEPLWLATLDTYQSIIGRKDRNHATNLSNLAILYFSLNRYQEAEKYLSEAIQIRKELVGEKHPEYLYSLSSFVTLYISTGRYAEAEQAAQNLVSTRKEVIGETHSDYASSISKLAGIYMLTGRYDEAKLLFEQAQQIYKEQLGENHPEYAQTLYNLAEVYIGTKDYAGAEKFIAEAKQIQQKQLQVLFPSLSEREKKDYFKSIKSYFESFNTFALLRQASNPSITAELYNNQLSTKALLLQATKKIRQNIINSTDTALIDKFEQWQTRREALARYYKFSKRDLQINGISLDSLAEQANSLEKEISSRSEAFAQAHDNKYYSWQDVQKVLVKGEAALEMIRFRKYGFEGAGKFTDTIHYAALVVTPQSQHPQLVFFENGNAMEGGMFKAYQADIRNQTQETDTYRHYFAPLKEALPGVKKLYFSPDGVYNQINLNTLYNAATREYVLDELDIVLVTSTKDLLQQKPEKKDKDRIAILVGYPDYNLSRDKQEQLAQSVTAGIEKASYGKLSLKRGSGFKDLPGTKQEVEQIASLFNRHQVQTKLYTGEEALEETIKSISNPQVLHIATHGYFEQDQEKASQNPLLRSGLLLAGAARSISDTITYDPLANDKLEDGILTAYEAMNLSLDGTELVVLSACETGLGEVENGEGVYGLQRAFKVAGAESLLMSLWKVDDKTTQELMSSFYKEWLKGKNKTEAFTGAQKRLRKKHKNPYYWGAFVLVGE